MTMPNIRLRVLLIVEKRSVYLVLCTAALAGAVAQAQFATVAGKVKNYRDLTVSGAKVLVFNSKSHKAVGNPKKVEPNGNYAIESLPVGTYDFVACAVSYDPDRVSGRSKRITSSGLTQIDFTLQPRPEGSPSRTFVFSEDVVRNTDGILYLRDKQTGCILAQLSGMANGQHGIEYRIAGEIPGNDLCVQKRSSDDEVSACIYVFN